MESWGLENKQEGLDAYTATQTQWRMWGMDILFSWTAPKWERQLILEQKRGELPRHQS